MTAINIIFPPVDQTHQHYVYTLAYPDGKVFYIGKGMNGRILDHEQDARKKNPKETNGYKINVIRKIWRNGGEVIKTKLAFFQTHEEAIAYEVALIFFMPDLTNLTDGGDGRNGSNLTEETRQKMSKARKGKPKPNGFGEKVSESNRRRTLSEETRKKISTTKTGNTHHTEESRRKISEAGKGRKLTQEQREKMRGRTLSPEQKEALMRGKRNWTPSEEWRRKISEASKKRVSSEETRQKISKANKGKPKPDGFGQKIAKANLGRKHSEETRQRIRDERLRRGDGDKTRKQIEAILAVSPDMSTKQIAEIIGRSENTVRIWKRRILEDK